MWILFIPIPVINGILRENWYKQKIGEIGTNIVGFFVLSSFFLIYTYLFFRNQISDFSISKLFLVGAVWLFMTLVFEFGIGLYSHRSWSYMLADYNILKGRLWPLCLVVIFFTPLIIRYFVKFK